MNESPGQSCPYHKNPTDPFREARQRDGVLVSRFPTAKNARIPMVLRHADVREAAKDWQTFSSAAPFEVPIPNEEDVRTVGQLPLEVDPPDQTEYRKLVEPIFNRPKLPEVIARMEGLVDGLVENALAGGSSRPCGNLPSRCNRAPWRSF